MVGSSVGLDGAGALTHTAFICTLLALGAAFAVAIIALDCAVSSACGTVLHSGMEWSGSSAVDRL